jgi:TPP-dependent trihydroxycyclohexane-1,2-dione (THcHDO) dehydratase
MAPHILLAMAKINQILILWISTYIPHLIFADRKSSPILNKLKHHIDCAFLSCDIVRFKIHQFTKNIQRIFFVPYKFCSEYI